MRVLFWGQVSEVLGVSLPCLVRTFRAPPWAHSFQWIWSKPAETSWDRGVGRAGCLKLNNIKLMVTGDWVKFVDDSGLLWSWYNCRLFSFFLSSLTLAVKGHDFNSFLNTSRWQQFFFMENLWGFLFDCQPSLFYGTARNFCKLSFTWNISQCGPGYLVLNWCQKAVNTKGISCPWKRY